MSCILSLRSTRLILCVHAVFGISSFFYFHCFNRMQASTDVLKSQITSLEAALAAAREEIASRTEHEAKLMSQFQVGPLLI